MATRKPPRTHTVVGLGEPKGMLLDPNAQSADPAHPPFVARPEGAPVYYGFPLLEESRTDGWILGVISDYADPAGCTEGDAFVQAPDGSRAGIVWAVGDFEIHEILPPSSDRWGVYGVPFSAPICDLDSLVAAIRTVHPSLRHIHARVTARD